MFYSLKKINGKMSFAYLKKVIRRSFGNSVYPNHCHFVKMKWCHPRPNIKIDNKSNLWLIVNNDIDTLVIFPCFMNNYRILFECDMEWSPALWDKCLSMISTAAFTWSIVQSSFVEIRTAILSCLWYRKQGSIAHHLSMWILLILYTFVGISLI